MKVRVSAILGDEEVEKVRRGANLDTAEEVAVFLKGFYTSEISQYGNAIQVIQVEVLEETDEQR